MGLVMFGIFVFMMAPVALIAWYYAVRKPAVGRVVQEGTWKPLADRLGARWIPAQPGVSRFHSMGVTFGGAQVTVIVFHQAAIDPAVQRELPFAETGGWRTFVSAQTVGGPAPAAYVVPDPRGKRLAVGDPQFHQAHRVVGMLGAQAPQLGPRFTPQVCQAFATLGNRYAWFVAGPAFLNLELPGVCADPAVLEAAITVVGAYAHPPVPAAYAPART